MSSPIYKLSKREFMRSVLPVSDRRLYFLTFQPYPKHKSFKRCQLSCGPVKDFLKKHIQYFFIIKEFCKSGFAHFHVIAFLKHSQTLDIKKCRFGSVDIVRTKAKLFKPVYPWNGQCSPDNIDVVGYNKFDRANPKLYSHVLSVLNRQYRELLARNKYLRRVWTDHPYKPELRKIFSYIEKDNPTLRYQHFDYSIAPEARNPSH